MADALRIKRTGRGKVHPCSDTCQAGESSSDSNQVSDASDADSKKPASTCKPLTDAAAARALLAGSEWDAQAAFAAGSFLGSGGEGEVRRVDICGRAFAMKQSALRPLEEQLMAWPANPWLQLPVTVRQGSDRLWYTVYVLAAGSLADALYAYCQQQQQDQQQEEEDQQQQQDAPGAKKALWLRFARKRAAAGARKHAVVIVGGADAQLALPEGIFRELAAQVMVGLGKVHRYRLRHGDVSWAQCPGGGGSNAHRRNGLFCTVHTRVAQSTRGMPHPSAQCITITASPAAHTTTCSPSTLPLAVEARELPGLPGQLRAGGGLWGCGPCKHPGLHRQHDDARVRRAGAAGGAKPARAVQCAEAKGDAVRRQA